jgi:hypothetical protein
MPEINPSRYLVTAGWNDVPHLDAKTKAELLAGTPPHLREARSEGKPSLGSGAIYPIAWSENEVRPFAIPAYWPRAYALDVGWKRTAALWGAWDRTDDTIYCYAEHYRGQAEPSIHAEAIKARGVWIKGVIDPAARGRGQADGAQLLAMYRQLGLKVQEADNSVEAGLFEVWQRLSTGRLKFFSTLSNLRQEYNMYRRDERGRIVKEHDHLMDALRYLVMSGKAVASVQAPVVDLGVQAPAGDTRAGY